MKFDAAFFDFDGVIADTEKASLVSWNKTLAEYGVSITDNDYAEYSGLFGISTAQRLVKRFMLNENPKVLLEKRERYLREYLLENGVVIYPGAEYGIKTMKKISNKVAIVSGSREETLKLKLRLSGVDKLVDFAIGLDDKSRGKPFPDLYLNALKIAVASPSKSIAFEDTSSGVEAAVSASIKCIAVPTEFSKLQDLSKAINVAKNLKEAVEMATEL